MGGSSSLPGRLFYHIDAHLPSGTDQRPVSGLFGAGIHILNLDLNDLHDVIFRELPDFGFARLFGVHHDFAR